MNRKKILAAALAAAFVLTAAPAMGTDITAMNWMRPAMAREAAPDYDESVKPLQHLDTTAQYFVDEDSQGVLLKSHWTSIGFWGDHTGSRQNIAHALTDYSVGEDSRFHKTRNSMTSTAKSMRKEMLAAGASRFYPFEYNSDLHIRRADSRVVSFQEFYSDYTGGAHGMFGVTGKTFDAATGRELKLTDVFSNMNGLGRAIKQQLMFDYPNASFTTGDGTGMRNEVDESLRNDSLIWTMDPRGVTFYFNPYLIGSYSEGIFQTTVLFSEYPDIYKKNPGTGNIQWAGPKEYCMELVPYQTNHLSDSLRDDRIWINGYDDEIMIEYCGEKLQDSCHAKRVRPVLVNLKDGRRYLYVDYTQDDKDYRLRVYDLNGNGPKFAGELPLTRMETPSDPSPIRTWHVMSDPDNFILYPAVGSTYSRGMWLRCRVGMNGLPEVYETEEGKG